MAPHQADHVSLRKLTVDPTTPLVRLSRGRFGSRATCAQFSAGLPQRSVKTLMTAVSDASHHETEVASSMTSSNLRLLLCIPHSMLCMAGPQSSMSWAGSTHLRVDERTRQVAFPRLPPRQQISGCHVYDVKVSPVDQLYRPGSCLRLRLLNKFPYLRYKENPDGRVGYHTYCESQDSVRPPRHESGYTCLSGFESGDSNLK